MNIYLSLLIFLIFIIKLVIFAGVLPLNVIQEVILPEDQLVSSIEIEAAPKTLNSHENFEESHVLTIKEMVPEQQFSTSTEIEPTRNEQSAYQTEKETHASVLDDITDQQFKSTTDIQQTQNIRNSHQNFEEHTVGKENNNLTSDISMSTFIKF